MAHSSTFEERLEQMERTRIQRLSLLQAEKDLQVTNSRLLASKLARLQCMKRRCLLLQQKVAYQNLRISSFKSLIEHFDAKYQVDMQELRVLKDEVEELEKLEKERERLYEMKGREMNVFRENVQKFAVESRLQVNELRNYAAEMRKSKLVGLTENMLITDVNLPS
ncbi:hypothetical protein K2173_005580 [Erythroxylum novogranatense]|uniref:Uncharacterized protein n=1 Tax=Erythroxylum novogranatense TaxID=1862640 RepID=A0AAV8T683_9ROSI|nr:hypothetical protein K2173_005580 [Erythroxylum novogranatense]